MFPEVDFGKTERARILSKASRLKDEIRAHEKILADAQRRGEPECQNTVARLERYRTEQYEVSRKI